MKDIRGSERCKGKGERKIAYKGSRAGGRQRCKCKPTFSVMRRERNRYTITHAERGTKTEVQMPANLKCDEEREEQKQKYKCQPTLSVMRRERNRNRSTNASQP